MTRAIARCNSHAARTFPDLTSDPYSTPQPAAPRTPDEVAARKLLALGSEGLSRSVRVGRGTTPRSRAARLMYLHRQAIAHELAGRRSRARFFWDEVANEWKLLPADHPAWLELAAELLGDANSPGFRSASQLRDAFGQEMLVDAQLAFYNGLVDQASSDDDDARLASYISQACHYDPASQDSVDIRRQDVLVRLTRFRESGNVLKAFYTGAEFLKAHGGEPQLARELPALYAAAVRACDEGKDVKELVRVSDAMARALPDELEYSDQLVQRRLQAAFDNHQPANNEAGSRAAAERLEGEIAALQHVAADLPSCHSVYDGLATLHHILAVSWANGDRLGRARLAIEKALTYRPGWSDAETARQKIDELAHSMAAKIADVKRQMGVRFENGRQVTTSLNAEGSAIDFDLRMGPIQLAEFRTKLPELQRAMTVARGRSLWLRSGAPRPVADWDGAAQRFVSALEALLFESPANAADLAAKWQRVVEERPHWGLEGIGAEHLSRLFFPADAPPASDSTGGSVANNAVSEDSSDAREAARIEQAAAALKLACQPATESDAVATVPLEHWLFNSRGAGTRRLAAAAVLLILVAGAAALVQSRRQAARDAAFAALTEAVEQYDADAGEEAVQQFLAAAPLTGFDPRLPAVQARQTELPELADRRRRDEAWQEFRQARESGEVSAALTAAEQFLQARPEETRDPRLGEFRSQYSKMFAQWLLESLDLNDPEQMAHIDRYRQLNPVTEP